MKENKIRVVSLFSGIGGFEEGIRRSGIPHDVVFASEIDNFAKISYSANFNNKNLHGDITQISEKDIPDHDLLIAGFPCQSFSIAGKQRGFNDTRGNLFFDVARILKEKTPKLIILENVKNLIGHDKSNTINQILTILNDIGYTIDFTIINSAEAGVPQNRDRTYIVGIYNYKSEKFDLDIRSDKVSKLKNKYNEEGFKSFNFFNNLSYKNKARFIEDILSDSVSKKYYFDNERINSFIEKNEIKYIEENEKKIIKIFDLPKEVHNDLERQRRVYSIKGISPTVLARSDSTKICILNNNELRIRKVTPEENFYIQGFDESFVKNIRNKKMSDTQMYKQSGNAVSPPVIEGIFKELYKFMKKGEKNDEGKL